MRPERAVAVLWPVELPPLAFAAGPRAAFRERHGIPGDAPVLLLVGRLHSVKRPIHAVEAFCRAEIGPAQLVIVGMDDDVSAAEAVAHGLSVILSPGHDLAYDMPKDEAGGLACGWLLPDDSLATAAQAISDWAGLAGSNAPRHAGLPEGHEKPSDEALLRWRRPARYTKPPFTLK